MDGLVTSFHAEAQPFLDRGEDTGVADLPSYLSRLDHPSAQIHAATLRHTGALLAILLEQPAGHADTCPALRPLWAEEAMHRAHGLLQLVALLEQRDQDASHADLVRRMELITAAHLAAQYQTLAATPERDIQPCSGVLRDVARDLTSLFGCAVGGVDLATDIERLSLPGYKRRALVLATSELIMNALRHAFVPGLGGRLIVSLGRAAPGQAILLVADDGLGCAISADEAARGIAGGLAELLEGTLAFRAGRAGTVAEIRFPISS